MDRPLLKITIIILRYGQFFTASVNQWSCLIPKGPISLKYTTILVLATSQTLEVYPKEIDCMVCLLIKKKMDGGGGWIFGPTKVYKVLNIFHIDYRSLPVLVNSIHILITVKN